MDKGRLNIIAATIVFLALAGCTTTQQQSYSHDVPILSAADAKAMIRVEVTELAPEVTEPVLVAATD